MNCRSVLSTLAVLTLGAGAAQPIVAQETTAEVRTWGGRTLNLTHPALEVQYTILTPTDQQAGGGSYAGAPLVGSGGGTGGSTGQFLTSMRAPEQALSKNPPPVQGRRTAQRLTLYQGVIAQHVPAPQIAQLTFQRQLVQNSTLPPYLAGAQYRHAATVTLADGTTVQGDYVNLGAAFLRGTTPAGPVEIPWREIEAVRFTR